MGEGKEEKVEKRRGVEVKRKEIEEEMGGGEVKMNE